jgi:molybdopterin synthase sulfur carrier subunit
MSKTVHVQYFALLREQRGQSKESLMTDARTISDLYAEVKIQYSFSLDRDVLRVAVNDKFVDWTTEFQSGDRIIFIPPVAGG